MLRTDPLTSKSCDGVDVVGVGRIVNRYGASCCCHGEKVQWVSVELWIFDLNHQILIVVHAALVLIHHHIGSIGGGHHRCLHLKGDGCRGLCVLLLQLLNREHARRSRRTDVGSNSLIGSAAGSPRAPVSVSSHGSFVFFVSFLNDNLGFYDRCVKDFSRCIALISLSPAMA